MNQTANYKLNQWEEGDVVRRSDFNADNLKLDAAIKAAYDAASAGAIQIVTGTYDGDGARTRTISLGFTPKLVYVCDTWGKTYESFAYYGGLAFTGHPIVSQFGDSVVEIVDGGFQVAHYYFNHRYVASNDQNTSYHYAALSW